MLSYGWPKNIDTLSQGVALYVALELPPIWEAAVLLLGTILDREFGSYRAILHPPHITLHPPFFPIVKLDHIVERLESVAGELQSAPISFATVESFNDDKGVPTQVVLKVDSGWCKTAHFKLVEGLRSCWDGRDELTMKLWPELHRLNGYVPHVSLAIGDMPSSIEARRAVTRRSTDIMRELFRMADAPLTFEPSRLSLVAYEHDWFKDPYRVVAGPTVTSVFSLKRQSTTREHGVT